MIIDCIADLHGYFPKLEGGDLLIVAGDLTATHTDREFQLFAIWLNKQQYRKKIFIAGNHDTFIEEWNKNNLGEPIVGVEYLCNSETEFTYEEEDVEKTIKIWGTPHSLIFEDVNPRCTAFMGTENDLKKEYDKIPEDIDILISHTPPYGILDKIVYGDHCGSISLRNTIMRVKPKYLICGHIHECGGKKIDLCTTYFINCSYVNECYNPVNKPVRIKLE